MRKILLILIVGFLAFSSVMKPNKRSQHNYQIAPNNPLVLGRDVTTSVYIEVFASSHGKGSSEDSYPKSAFIGKE